ncbi:hypothetical protein BGY98DRAFT_960529 [Russula aff. rugulosa BPL654]|nr:hypothetical protein BGY98DRAFT_960529 [Russula aff. rugulosa BPL654]
MATEETQDWKRMFRISTNWRSGRCHTSILDNASSYPLGGIYQSSAQQVRSSGQEQGHMVPRITLAGKYTIISSPQSSHSPSILILSASGSKHVVHVEPIRTQHLVRVTALAVDQSSRTSANLHIAACLSNGDIYVHELHSHPRKHYYAPPFKTPRTAPIIQVAYCHPVLVTLSESFTLSVYDLTHEGIQLVHLILTYASPVYPAHWSVGVTEVILSNAALHAPTSAFTSPTRRPSSLLLSTRSTRAFDIPAGWIDEAKLRVVREQWGRKVGSVAGTQTDGRWVVLAPAVQGEVRPPGGFTPASLPLQLYRLSSPPLRAGAGAAPKLTFVRSLLGQTGPVSALALADGRCVSLGVDGRVWVAFSTDTSNLSESGEDDPSTLRGIIAFDERRIISAGATGDVTVRDFDV